MPLGMAGLRSGAGAGAGGGLIDRMTGEGKKWKDLKGGEKGRSRLELYQTRDKADLIPLTCFVTLQLLVPQFSRRVPFSSLEVLP